MEQFEAEDKDVQDREETETVEEKIDRLGVEIQDLKEEVAELLNTLPPSWIPPVPEPLLKLRRSIKEKDIERELLLEDQRASKVVKEYRKENPTIEEKAEECPICLEPIFDVSAVVKFLCCGKQTCGSCSDPLSAAGNDICPLCREEFPSDDEALSILRTKAAEGKAWAQCNLGNKFFYGLSGLEEDEQKAECLFRSAADQGHAHAQHCLGQYEIEKDNVVEACRLFEAAASQGHMNALGFLGAHYYVGHGVEQDKMKAVRFLTVSSKLTAEDRRPHEFLARCFVYGEGGVERSPIRAVYCMKPTAEESEFSPHDKVFYAKLLWILSKSYFPDYEIAPSGDNSVPEALFWYRRAHAISGDAETVPCIEEYESSIRELCSCCFKSLSTDNRKCCVECKAVYYCNRECQVADWKAGHKKDCVKSLKKRLRATENFDDI